MPSAQILSIQLCQGVADWFSQSTNFVDETGAQLFKEINPYLRLDNNLSQSPTVNIYPKQVNLRDLNAWETGVISVDIIFNLAKQRNAQYLSIITTLETVRANMLSPQTQAQYIQTFLGENYVPGLQMFQCRSQVIDMSELKNKMQNIKNSSIVFTLDFDYKISIWINQQYAWQHGYDYQSPYTPIYSPRKPIVTINEVPYQQPLGE